MLAQEVDERGRVYFTGGATALLFGWRDATIDIDLQIVPESDKFFRALPGLKDKLQVNIELASPSHFIPELPGWIERSPFIGQEHSLSFYHYDLYAQALSKIERSHQRDRQDVCQMIRRGLISPSQLSELFEKIFPLLYKYPAIDPAAFRRNLESVLSESPEQ